ncbi:MAG: S-methyl-5'-thioadenosine phosphorylase [Elusimicrobia bacterium]|nr:S-methyl-5'-thioadenosine phosphorylase [Elusimicrobiota bacterium]
MKNIAKKDTRPARCLIGVIGGSGLYEMASFSKARSLNVKTPFGPPSGPIRVGELRGVPCAFLPRHGPGHVLLPSELNSRANIYALKSLGIEKIISIGAVGSLKEELPPRHFVFPDQLADETKGRPSTFFGEGIVAHVAFDKPFCLAQSRLLHGVAERIGITAHWGGTYICMEGPAFSTKAESEFHRKMGYSVIGMTALPEAKLAREAEICYSTVALVTDYDCWKEGEEVSSDKVVENLLANVNNARRLLEEAVGQAAERPRNCPCAEALKGAIFTNPKSMNKKILKKLSLLVGKYIKP